MDKSIFLDAIQPVHIYKQILIIGDATQNLEITVPTSPMSAPWYIV